MSVLNSPDVLRPAPGGIGGWARARFMATIPFLLSIGRRFFPILKLGSMVVVTRYDDVLEVFATDTAFGVVYKPNLDVITGGEPFFLGMANTQAYRDNLAAMQRMVLKADLDRLGDEAERRAEAFVAAAGGRVDVVGLVRRVTFDTIAGYFGVSEPPLGRLDVWATRLFEYQFTGSPKDTGLVAQVQEIAPAFRAHVDAEIARRKLAPHQDDVLGRCLNQQAEGTPGYSDQEIRTALMCMVVGGPPQPPMVVPQGMEQILRRPDILAAAQRAALAGDNPTLHDILFEAMRFDPLAPGLPREVLADTVLARGTSREKLIPKGATVLACFASAMMDPRRIDNPTAFIPGRPPSAYIHFGHGLHECFGRHINHATLHRMLKPLLARPGLRRAPGAEGRLSKNGIFAERLVVVHD